jgi:hypothetical protein
LETWDALPQAEPEIEVSPLDLAEVRTAHRLTAG